MGKDTPTKVMNEESMISMESIEYDNSGQDEKMKDNEHVNNATQITPPPLSTSLDQLNSISKSEQANVGLVQQQQSSTSPLTPPTTQPEAANGIEAEQSKVPKKRGRKSTAKPAEPAKRKKTTARPKKTVKTVESENEIKIKEEESTSSLNVFEFTESDDESEAVDELMPTNGSKKKSSVNKQKSTTKKTSAISASKKSVSDAKGSTTPKIKNAWQQDEDKILIDKILADMPSPSWSTISQSLKDRNANACLVRWKILKKRLYQN
ncbi:hypothetical protein C1645_774839 [Glomus cerebriforme]|uniref:Uncharacterized protein n=1 Tax=Glomus cerebriforme TaxID=658196 RepID=A0A397SQL1_9GLOM|nr:hypothetical protein C1645_774839 [Glomus cerebriforme]